MTFEGETRTRAGRWNLELVDDFLPELIRRDTLKSAPQYGGLEELAEI